MKKSAGNAHKIEQYFLEDDATGYMFTVRALDEMFHGRYKIRREILKNKKRRQYAIDERIRMYMYRLKEVVEEKTNLEYGRDYEFRCGNTMMTQSFDRLSATISEGIFYL